MMFISQNPYFSQADANVKSEIFYFILFLLLFPLPLSECILCMPGNWEKQQIYYITEQLGAIK